MKIGNYREFPGCPVVGTWHSLPGPRFNAWFGSKIPQCTRRQPKKKKKEVPQKNATMPQKAAQKKKKEKKTNIEKQTAILLCSKSNDREITGYY